jgi:hypothetical protein
VRAPPKWGGCETESGKSESHHAECEKLEGAGLRNTEAEVRQLKAAQELFIDRVAESRPDIGHAVYVRLREEERADKVPYQIRRQRA